MHTQGFSQICIHCLLIAARIIPWKMKQKRITIFPTMWSILFFQPHHQKESPCIFILKFQLSVLGYYLNTQIWHISSFMTPRLKNDYDLWPIRPSSTDLSMLPQCSFSQRLHWSIDCQWTMQSFQPIYVCFKSTLHWHIL